MNRRQALFGLTAATTVSLLSGCGFRPLYGGSSDSSFIRDNPLKGVSISLIEDREGQILRNFLIDRFQPDGTDRYILTTELDVSEQDLGVAFDATTTRSRVVVTAGFVLSYEGGSYRFTSRSAGSYSTVLSDYGTLVARQDATERSLREIADEAKVRLVAFLSKLEAG
jgi:LPS-assembly lipoprotein